MLEERHFYDWLKPFGFKPGTVVFKDRIAFTVDDLLDSLCLSTPTSPKVVPVSIDVDTSASIDIDMARRIQVRGDQPGIFTSMPRIGTWRAVSRGQSSASVST